METEIDIELATAQAALASARQRKAQAEEAARVAAAAALAKNLADEQERLARLQREAEETQKKWAEKRAAEAAVKVREEQARLTETRRLEAEYEALQEAARQEAARQERIRKVTEQARQAEIDAANLEASLLQASAPKDEPKPTTLGSTPLWTIFSPTSTSVAPARETSATEQAAIQARRDAEKITLLPARKSSQYVDSCTSRELEGLLRKELGISPNTQRCDSLSAVWNYTHLMHAARQVAEQTKLKPVGHDQIFSLIESVLESSMPLDGGSNGKAY